MNNTLFCWHDALSISPLTYAEKRLSVFMRI
jgi:hypothetical protein